MMGASTLVWIYLALVLLSGGSVEGLSCFVCRGRQDPGCNDPFQERPSYVMDCSKRTDYRNPNTQPVGCKKIVNFDRVSGETMIYRDCAYGFNGFAQQGPGCYVQGGGATICVCNTFNCNGANALRTGVTLTTVLLTATYSIML